MEAILGFNQQEFKSDRALRIITIAVLLVLLGLFFGNLVYGYDFSGGYNSSKVLGSGTNILTIGGMGSGQSALDVGEQGESQPVSPNPTPNIGRQILVGVLPVAYAAGVILLLFRSGNWAVVLIGAVIGFIILQALLSVIP